MDANGDHGSDLSKKGLRWNNRHSALMRNFGREPFRAAGAGTLCEVPYLVPGLNLRPADILVHPSLSPGSDVSPRDTAYDVTITSPFVSGALNKAASGPRALKNSADDAKRRKLGQRLRSVPLDSDTPSWRWNAKGWKPQPCCNDCSLTGASSPWLLTPLEHRLMVRLRSSKSTPRALPHVLGPRSRPCRLAFIRNEATRSGPLVWPQSSVGLHITR